MAGGIHADASDYQRLFAASRTLDPVIRREMKKRLRNAAKIGSTEARAKVRAMPALGYISQVGQLHGQRHHGTRNVRGRSRGLRSVLALNIKVQVGAKDVRIIQSTAGISGRNARGLPRRLDAGGPWLHPVFGYGETAQLGYSYFKRPIAAKKPQMLEEVGRVLDEIARHLR